MGCILGIGDEGSSILFDSKYSMSRPGGSGWCFGDGCRRYLAEQDKKVIGSSKEALRAIEVSEADSSGSYETDIQM